MPRGFLQWVAWALLVLLAGFLLWLLGHLVVATVATW